MNSSTHTPRTPLSARRAVPALAVIALAVGLGACASPAQVDEVPQAPVVLPAKAPAGIDTSLPVDRMVEQLERQAARTAELVEEYRGRPVDRLVEQLEREAGGTQESTADRFRGVPADRVVEQLEREAARTARVR